MGSSWKFFYTLAMPVLLCWIPICINTIADDYLLGNYLYIVVLVVSLFVVQAIPFVVSSMVVLVLLPLLLVQEAKFCGENVMREQTILIVGQMALGCAVVICNLHKRLALSIMAFTGNAQQRVITGIFFVTLVFALILSSPTAAFIMLATVQAFCNEREFLHEPEEKPRQTNSEESHVNSYAESITHQDDLSVSNSTERNSAEDKLEIHETDETQPLDNFKIDPALPLKDTMIKDVDVTVKVVGKPISKDNKEDDDKEFKRQCFIAIYVAANIGGLLLPHTSPSVNLLYDYTDCRARTVGWGLRKDEVTTVFAYLPFQFGGEMQQMNVLHWIAYALPLVIVLGFVAWIYLLIVFMVLNPLKSATTGVFMRTRIRQLVGKRDWNDKLFLNDEKSLYRQKLAKLGKVDIHQFLVIILTAVVVCFWMTRDPRFYDGWSRRISDFEESKESSNKSNITTTTTVRQKIKVGDSSVVFLFIVLMFVIPRFRNKPSDPKPLAILTWKFLEGQIFWNVIVMFGCQFVASEASLTTNRFNVTHNNVTFPMYHGGFRIMLEKQVDQIYHNSPSSFIFVITGMSLLGSELFGGVATLNILLYILSLRKRDVTPGKMFSHGGITRGYFGLPATAMTSLSFMFPVATASNAIVFTLGSITDCLDMLDTVKYGAFLDIFSWIMIIAYHYIYTQFLGKASGMYIGNKCDFMVNKASP